MNIDNIQKSPEPVDARRQTALERSVRNMKMVIAGLSIALVACVVYILASPTDFTPSRNGMTGTYPPATQQSMPANAQQGRGTVPDGAANTQRDAATTNQTNGTSPAPAANRDVQPGQKSGKINPAHGQPGHRCDIPVGSDLP